MTTALRCSTEELLAVLLSREYHDGETAACGALSFIPAAAMLLAAHTRTPNLDVIILSSDVYDPFMHGPDFHNLAQRGQLDLFHISGIEIDREANFNLHVIGDRDRPDVLMPGQYGTGMLYYAVPRILMFRTEHTRRSFPERVNFVSGAGTSPEGFARRTREVTVITTMATLRLNQETRVLELASVHPGYTAEQVQANTGFDLGIRGPAPETPPVTAEELHTLRTVVREHMMETGTYVDLARTLLVER